MTVKNESVYAEPLGSKSPTVNKQFWTFKSKYVENANESKK